MVDATGMRHGTSFTRGRVDSRAGMDGCGKIPSPLEFDPRTVQLVESRYTDYAVPVYKS